MILILSGPIRSYKTTTLANWSKQRTDCGGFLTPDIEGVRYIMNVCSKEIIPFQISEKKSEQDLLIGRFVFDHLSFDQAGAWIKDHLVNPKIEFLLLDEIGPLELKDMGWHSLISFVLTSIKEKTLILVVREHLLKAVVEKYDLQNAKVIDVLYFS